jgi:hypothetical protein
VIAFKRTHGGSILPVSILNGLEGWLAELKIETCVSVFQRQMTDGVTRNVIVSMFRVEKI